jgi:hypothetical protein
LGLKTPAGPHQFPGLRDDDDNGDRGDPGDDVAG